MGGGSNGNSSSNSYSNKFYSDTTTKNPYVLSHTNNSGTTTSLQPNTALSSVYNFTNQNIDKLLSDYLHPNLNSDINQAKIQAYQKNLNEESRKALENNIIAPLSQRRMIRSSQATDMYNNLANQQTDSLDNYVSSLLSSSQNDTANIINNLMNLAFQGYNVISGNQAQSLNTSSGNAASASSGSSTGSSAKYGL